MRTVEQNKEGQIKGEGGPSDALRKFEVKENSKRDTR
jgi:hypothetical protein